MDADRAPQLSALLHASVSSELWGLNELMHVEYGEELLLLPMQVFKPENQESGLIPASLPTCTPQYWFYDLFSS